MKFEVNIEKKHLLIFAGILAVALFGFVYAQSAPNPGHSFNQLSGVQAAITGSCSTGNAIRVINSDGTVTCQSVGSGGGSTTVPVNGSVVGGGIGTYGFGTSNTGCTNAQLWGVATCGGSNNNQVTCPTGTTRRPGQLAGTNELAILFCIKN